MMDTCSDSARLGGKRSIHPADLLPRNTCFFSNTGIHILIPSLSVLCFIDAREVISDVRLPAAFVKHSFASCNIITASGKLDREEECLGSERAMIYHEWRNYYFLAASI